MKKKIKPVSNISNGVKKYLLLTLAIILILIALSAVQIRADMLIPFFCKAVDTYAEARTAATGLSIRLLGGLSFENLQFHHKNGLIINVGKGTLSYDLSDILRRQLRIKVSAKDVMMGRGQKPVKGFLESFLLPEPETKIHFDDAVFSINFRGGAKELENLQFIGDTVVITADGKSIGKKSINYNVMLYLSQKMSSELLAQYGSPPSENSASKNTILLRIYGQPKFPFVYIMTKNLRMSFKVGRQSD